MTRANDRGGYGVRFVGKQGQAGQLQIRLQEMSQGRIDLFRLAGGLNALGELKQAVDGPGSCGQY